VTVERLNRLDALVDFRNAIGHGDEERLAATERPVIMETKPSYDLHRQA
jgi:hypothetical protein